MKPKLLFTIIAICFMKFGAGAQTTPVKIMDLVTIPAFSTDSTVTSDSIYVIVNFKISDCQNANKAHLQFGTSTGLSDVFNFSPDIIFENSKYYIVHEGKKTEVFANSARVIIGMTMAQFQSYHSLSLYIEDTANQLSNTLSANK